MKCNVGGSDRIIRVVFGLLILGAGVMLNNWLGVVGLVSLLTGAAGRCLLYLPFGISTCGARKQTRVS